MTTALVHPVTGRKLGRTRPPPIAERRMHLPFNRYVKANLPKAPARTNYRAKAMAGLGRVYLNDTLGDCTAAGAFHIEGVWRANAGAPTTFSDSQVEAFYSGSTGYVPGNAATDNGGNEIQVLDYWRDHGLIGGQSKILGHLSVDAGNLEHLRLAVFLFEHGYGGAELPDVSVNSGVPENSGGRWDLSGAPNQENGHCPPIVDIENDDFVYSTWGMWLLGSAKDTARLFVPENGGEMHVAVSADMLNKVTLKAPSGFDIGQLRADLAAIGTPEA